MLTRRNLIQCGAAAAALSWPNLAFAQGLRRRRNIATMLWSDPDLVAFRNGIAVMRARSDELSYEEQRRIHERWDAQHGTWRFLPWHRVQLAAFEKLIAHFSGKDDFALPYWDWQQTPQLPSVLFSDPVLALPGRMATSSTNFAQQRWGRSPIAAQVLTDDFPTFAGQMTYAGRVEGYAHNLIHTIVGGSMSNPTTATLDPVFWLHHANIDRVWSTWHRHQKRDYPTAFLNEKFGSFQDISGPFPQVSARDVLDTSTYGYDYDAPYPFPVFAITLAAPHGTTSRLVQSTSKFEVVSRGTGQSQATLDLPGHALAMLRADIDQLIDYEGTGSVHISTRGLTGRVVLITASTGNPAQEVVIAAAPAFFHDPASVPAQHLAHGETWGVAYKFSREILNLIGTTRGPVRLAATTVPAFGEPGRPIPSIAAMSLALKLDHHRWV